VAPRFLLLPLVGLLVTVAASGLAQEVGSPPKPAPPDSAAETTTSSPQVPAVAPAETGLEAGERDTLLRLAWQTLVGHLTSRPIKDKDLEAYTLTPRLQQPRGCFVTLKIGGEVRGLQGEIEAARPLYQQVIVFTRRAATRDPRFLPLTDLDLDKVVVEIAVIGRRERIEGPEALHPERQGVFLEKWGRRAIFLPGVAAAQGWNAERTLEELCRQASLPARAWAQGGRLEAFEAEIIAGPRPGPAQAAPLPERPVEPEGSAAPGSS